MMGFSLYEIDREIQEALESALYYGVDEETGEVIEGNFALLESLAQQREEKLDSIGCYIKALEAEVAAMDIEKKALTERIAQKKNRVEKLKLYVTDSMLLNGEKKFESARVAFSFRKGSKVEIVNESLLPEAFVKVKTEISPDKVAIKKAINTGEDVAGAILTETMSLQMK